MTVNVKVASATHESPLPTCGGGVGGEGNGHDLSGVPGEVMTVSLVIFPLTTCKEKPGQDFRR